MYFMRENGEMMKTYYMMDPYLLISCREEHLEDLIEQLEKRFED